MIQARRHTAGFTLVELVLTIIIAAILGAVFVISRAPDASIKLPSQIQRLMADIRYTQSLSLFRNQRYRLDLSNSTSYQILNSQGQPVTYVANHNDTVTLEPDTTLSTSTTDKYLVFDGHGTPYMSATASGNGTALSSDLHIALTQNGVTQSLTVTPTTGEVHTS